MAISSTELDAWVAYFQLLQEIADEVSLIDKEKDIIDVTSGGREGT
jgi:hypothetical protein